MGEALIYRFYYTNWGRAGILSLLFFFVWGCAIIVIMMKPIILPYKGIVPQIDETAYIADNAAITGDVHIGAESSVWFNVAMRGDVGDIRIGRRTNIQDGSVVHITGSTHGVTIGDEVTVGHMAMLHSCIIADRCLVGMQSCLLDNSRMEEGSMLAAGSLLTPKKVVPSGQLWAGRPAKYVRDLTEEEVAFLSKSADNYVRVSRDYLSDRG